MKTLYLISQHGIVEVDYESFLNTCAKKYYPGYSLVQVEYWILNYKFVARNMKLIFYRGDKFYNVYSQDMHELLEDFTRCNTNFLFFIPFFFNQIKEEEKQGFYD